MKDHIPVVGINVMLLYVYKAAGGSYIYVGRVLIPFGSGNRHPCERLGTVCIHTHPINKMSGNIRFASHCQGDVPSSVYGQSPTIPVIPIN